MTRHHTDDLLRHYRHTVILSVTAVAVRILADNLLQSINKARTNEKDIRHQAMELKESEEKSGHLLKSCRIWFLFIRMERLYM